MTTTCGTIDLADVVAYWAEDLAPTDVDRLDEHLMGCATCSSASVGISAVTEALRAVVPPFVDRARVDALRLRGYRVHENPLLPGDRKPVIFHADTDFLIHELRGLDLTNATAVDVVITVEETGDVLIAEASAPFDRDSGEVLIACQRHFAAFPPNVVVEVRARDATGSERVARYPIPHIYEARKGE
jgi:hypothetical protein